jgi:ATP-dependent Zn protease
MKPILPALLLLGAAYSLIPPSRAIRPLSRVRVSRLSSSSASPRHVATVTLQAQGGDGNKAQEAAAAVSAVSAETTTSTSTGVAAAAAGTPPPWRFKPVVLAVLLVKIAVLKVQMFTQRISSQTTKTLQKSKAGKVVLKTASVLRQRKVWTRLVLAIASYLFITKYIRANRALTTEVSFASFLKLLEKHPDKISSMRVSPSTLSFLFNGKQVMSRVVQTDSFLLSKLLASGVDFASPPQQVNVLGLVWTFVYGLFLWTVTSRMMQGPQDEGAGRRRDQMVGSLSFADVAGQERAKLEVKEVCEMLRDPGRYSAVGARVPAGVLLVGPPGTGKTLLARVAAAEAGVPFYACSATDFVEVFVGRGPARVRRLFKTAAETAPCIVFIDEIDSIGRSRRMGSLNSEQENTLNQLLTSMDGLDTSNNGVVVMAATNRLELLDPALMRAGRFDRIVQCPLPDKDGRKAILAVHAKRLSLDSNVDLDRIAKITPGTCGADLAAITNEAAIRTARRGANKLGAEDFEDAVRSFFAGRGVSMGGLAEAVLGRVSGVAGGVKNSVPPATAS